jgi:predicted SAM-dependent methyltransferase
MNRKRRDRAISQLRKFQAPYKLHIGCGPIRLDGWINIDNDPNLHSVDIVWDATREFPLQDSSCAFVYNEHFLEHLSVESGASFLRECYRLLIVGGILRVAMPSLEVIVQRYVSEDWRNQDWLTSPDYQFVQTRAEMLNIAFRWWGHQWLYDREELHRRLREAGFFRIMDVDWGKSETRELKGRETRADSLLICEAQK